MRSIIDLAHNLKLEVVAEGVETAERARSAARARLRRGAGPLHLPAGERAAITAGWPQRRRDRPPRDRSRFESARGAAPISVELLIELVSFSCSARTNRVYGATASITPRTLRSTSRSNCAREVGHQLGAHPLDAIAQLRLWRARASTGITNMPSTAIVPAATMPVTSAAVVVASAVTMAPRPIAPACASAAPATACARRRPSPRLPARDRSCSTALVRRAADRVDQLLAVVLKPAGVAADHAALRARARGG